MVPMGKINPHRKLQARSFAEAWLCGRIVASIVIGLACVALSVPYVALAAFTRPFLHQIVGTPTGLMGSEAPFTGPSGAAVDKGGHLWIGDGAEELDEFGSCVAGASSCGEFLGPRLGPTEPIKIKGSNRARGAMSPESLVIDEATGDFYFTGEHTVNLYEPFIEVIDEYGNLVDLKEWNEKEFGPYSHIAIDNACASHAPPLTELTTPTCKQFDPSNGSVYVAHEGDPQASEGGDGLPSGIGKFDASGKPVDFSGSASCQKEECGYIEKNQITGVPGESFVVQGGQEPGTVTVDRQGNIYIVDQDYDRRQGGVPAVVEYNSEGKFVRHFSGESTPGLGEDREDFGGTVEGVAVDPVSDHVLVSVDNGHSERGAIDEFDSTGSFLDQITEASGGEPLLWANGHGVGEMSVDSVGDLYVVDSASHDVDVYGPGHFLPTVTVEEAGEREPKGAVLNGTVNPEGLVLTDCHFEYIPEVAFEHNVAAHNGEEEDGFAEFAADGGGEQACDPGAETITPSSSAQAVHARITALTAGITYRFRLVATSSGGLGGTGASKSLAFTPPDFPSVQAGSTVAENISATFADLHSVIDPLGANTSYYFQYVIAAHYNPNTADPYDAGATAPVTPVGAPTPAEVVIGSGAPTGGTSAAVVQQIGGLTSGAIYHFRVVATNKIGKTYGPDHTFATVARALAGLPDGRADELVTPENKGSAEDMFGATQAEHNEFSNRDVGYPSQSGEEFLLETQAAFGSFAASGENAYVFRREEQAGWHTISLASTSLAVQSVRPDVFDPSQFASLGVEDDAGSTAGAAGIDYLNLLGAAGGPYFEMTNEFSSGKGANALVGGTTMVGASRDLSHIVLESINYGLAPGVASQDAGSHVLYEWHNGAFTVVSVKPNGTPFLCGAMLGQASVHDNGGGERHNAISADGSKVIFTAPDPFAKEVDNKIGQGCWGGGESTTNAPQVYMRVDGETVELSSPERGVADPSGSHPAVYVGASENGTKVFFVTETELTKEAEILQLHDPELYECNVVEEAGRRRCKLTRVSAGNAESPGRDPNSPGGQVYTVPVISPDGSAVYFTAFDALAAGAAALPVTRKGEINLYRYATQTGVTTYVATIDTRDYPMSFVGGWWGHEGSSLASHVALETEANWDVTPEGRFLVFASTSDITGYNTTEAAHAGPADCPVLRGDSPPFGHCDEVYRYDALLPISKGSATMPDNPSCLSCDRSDAPPISNAFFAEGAGAVAPAGGSVTAISSNGACAFFDSADPLVPEATNGTLNVYEWEAQGASACQGSHEGSGCELSEGCLYLLNSSQSPVPSYFLGASVDGANVFFGTHARLAPQDTDEAGDLYDARIGGGFAFGSGVGPCEGDACQNPQPAPIDSTPGSLTFSGAGNLLPEVKSAAKLTNAQKLAKALKVCKRDHSKQKRSGCELQARKRYGPKKKPLSSKLRGKPKRSSHGKGRK